MTFASSIKSSSHMAPSRIALMATLYWARHLPSLTTPNSPLPSSLIKVSSEGLISHFSVRQMRQGYLYKEEQCKSMGKRDAPNKTNTTVLDNTGIITRRHRTEMQPVPGHPDCTTSEDHDNNCFSSDMFSFYLWKLFSINKDENRKSSVTVKHNHVKAHSVDALETVI